MNLAIDPSFEPLRQMVAWLGKEKLRPLGLECDRADAPLAPEHPFFTEVLGLGMTGGFVGKLDDASGGETPKESQSGQSIGKPSRAARRAVVLAEEAAYWDRGMATSLPGPSLGAPPLLILGSEEQKKRWLSIFKDPKTPHWGAFAMSEPNAGSDVAAIRTSARKDGDGWRLSGEKCFCSNGGRASWVVVWATVDPKLGRAGHRAFVVDRGTSGFRVARIEKKMGLRASETASLVLDDCRLGPETLLGGDRAADDREGFKGAMRTFDMTRPMVAAMAVGIGRAAHDEALAFAKEHLSGASAHRLARVKDKLATIRRKLETARLLAWKAAWLADQKRPNSLEASIAKAFAPPVALEAASLGLDVLGEAGGASDRLIEKLYRDVKALDIVEGTGQIQRNIVAKHLVGFGASARDEGASP